MRYKLLGNSGLRVSELCLGTMTFGEDWGWGASLDESKAIYEAFREAGGNFIDTANGYQQGQSEEWVGEWMASRGNRDDLVIATQYSTQWQDKQPEKIQVDYSGNSTNSMNLSLEGSLRTMKRTYVDLF